ncbi:hypothetical protein AQ790_00530 [Burkholderia pseudomallei]|nr:hypothetical protein AQ790_00530 [Burkholderia pseudomallei]
MKRSQSFIYWLNFAIQCELSIHEIPDCDETLLTIKHLLFSSLHILDYVNWRYVPITQHAVYEALLLGSSPNLASLEIGL